MALSDAFSRVVELIGAAAVVVAGAGRAKGRAGSSAAIRRSRPPRRRAAFRRSRCRPPRVGAAGQTPNAAPGLKVNAFATDLKHPRWICVLPTGDVLVAEALLTPEPISSLFDYAMFSTLQTGRSYRRQPQPHHAFARRRWRRRRRDPERVPRAAEPAVRHGAPRRHVLRRQYRWRGCVSLYGRARTA